LAIAAHGVAVATALRLGAAVSVAKGVNDCGSTAGHVATAPTWMVHVVVVPSTIPDVDNCVDPSAAPILPGTVRTRHRVEATVLETLICRTPVKAVGRVDEGEQHGLAGRSGRDARHVNLCREPLVETRLRASQREVELLGLDDLAFECAVSNTENLILAFHVTELAFQQVAEAVEPKGCDRWPFWPFVQMPTECQRRFSRFSWLL
jgi:hypothetical protein